MSEKLGSGPAIDEEYDWYIGATGDIETVQGGEELSKDLTLNLSVGLQKYIGSNPTGEMVEEIERDIRVLSLADERVEAVLSADAEITDVGSIDASVSVLANDGEQYDLVVEL